MTDRRQFAKIALAGATAAATIRTGSAKLTPIPPGVKIGANSVPASEDNFRYLKQLGVTWVSIAPQAPYDAESFIKQRELWEKNGFKIYNSGSGQGPSGSLHNMEEVTLNLPGRDDDHECPWLP